MKAAVRDSVVVTAGLPPPCRRVPGGFYGRPTIGCAPGPGGSAILDRQPLGRHRLVTLRGRSHEGGDGCKPLRQKRSGRSGVPRVAAENAGAAGDRLDRHQRGAHADVAGADSAAAAGCSRGVSTEAWPPMTRRSRPGHPAGAGAQHPAADVGGGEVDDTALVRVCRQGRAGAARPARGAATTPPRRRDHRRFPARHSPAPRPGAPAGGPSRTGSAGRRFPRRAASRSRCRSAGASRGPGARYLGRSRATRPASIRGPTRFGDQVGQVARVVGVRTCREPVRGAARSRRRLACRVTAGRGVPRAMRPHFGQEAACRQQRRTGLHVPGVVRRLVHVAFHPALLRHAESRPPAVTTSHPQGFHFLQQRGNNAAAQAHGGDPM